MNKYCNYTNNVIDNHKYTTYYISTDNIKEAKGMDIPFSNHSVQAEPPVTIICGEKSATIIGSVEYRYSDGQQSNWGSFNLLASQINDLLALEAKSSSDLSNVCDLF